MRKWVLLAILLTACSEDEPVVVSRAPDGTITMAFETSKCINSASIVTRDGNEVWYAGLNDRTKCLDRISTNYRGPAYTVVEKGKWGPGPECLTIDLSATGVLGRKQFCY